MMINQSKRYMLHTCGSHDVCCQEQPGIVPYMFKAIVGRGHQEFGSSRQQDAQEFYLHIMTLIDRHNVTTSNPVKSFKFQVSSSNIIIIIVSLGHSWRRGFSAVKLVK